MLCSFQHEQLEKAKELLGVTTPEPASEMTTGQPAQAADEPEAVKPKVRTRHGGVRSRNAMG